jgi:hypothetical protein
MIARAVGLTRSHRYVCSKWDLQLPIAQTSADDNGAQGGELLAKYCRQMLGSSQRRTRQSTRVMRATARIPKPINGYRKTTTMQAAITMLSMLSNTSTMPNYEDAGSPTIWVQFP